MIYLDNSATTRMSDAALRAYTEAAGTFANPSSLHAAGNEAAILLSDSRQMLLKAAGFRKRDGFRVFFTASGSEATNLALIGSAGAKNHFGSRRIITTDSEHPSVMNSLKRLEKDGFETVRIPTAGGRIDLKVLEEELRKGAFLVSVMLVNNETGALYDYESVARLTRAVCPGALLHCDAVQGFIRVPLPVSSADMITVSAHKIHGPKGVGALFVSPDIIRRRALSPVIFGGGQEDGMRSGTENVQGIAAFAAAAGEGAANSGRDSAVLEKLYAYASEVLPSAGVRINVPEKHVSHIMSITLPGIRSQTMLGFLSSKGICVSSGSACSSKDSHISPVLKAFGLSDRDADSTLRVSFCAQNTTDEIDRLTEALSEGIGRLVRTV